METIVQNLFFNLDDLKMTKTSFGTHFFLKDCNVEGKPGAPAFPVKNISVALPPRTKIVKLSETIVKKTLVSNEPIAAECIQEPKIPYRNKDDWEKHLRQMPDEDLYKKSINATIAVMGKTITIGDIPVAGIAVIPMRYAADERIEFIEHLILEITLAEDTDQFEKPLITSFQRDRERSRVHELVINSDLLKRFPIMQAQNDADNSYALRQIKSLSGNVDYLIVTDNNKWNGQTMTVTGSAGAMTTEFYRLAQHKKTKGYRVHVAQIKDIVEGKYGDFKTDSRDLQEIIRNFLKEAVLSWGVEWLLLGGDVSIIPPRLACGCANRRVNRGSTDNINQSEWRDTFLGMHVNFNQLNHENEPNDNTNVKFPFILTNYNTGARIPFDANGTSDTSNPGWYFCTDNTFSVRNTTGRRTEFIRVNGPANQINADMVCYVYENMIPSDLYYASLYSNLYNRANLHDWDLLNNGLYGQHTEDNHSLGGVDFRPDVSVGRAPVESQEEAKIFVDKVIEYDKWGTSHPSTDYNRFKKMLYVANNWGWGGENQGVLDDSVSEQEELLKWMHGNFPRINQIQRLYEDAADLLSMEGGGWSNGEGLEVLTPAKLEQALNGAPHFVSFTGHGWYGGVGDFNIDMAKRLTNGNKTFIAFADSCYTGEFDMDDALGEYLLLHEGGGAVAYIGNSREGWVGIGKDFRLKFFQYMKDFRHIGLLNDGRYTLTNTPFFSVYKIWTVFEQTLFGDPEMNVYRDDQDAIPRFVGNKRTMQFHQSTCEWVEWMADHNKEYFDSIEEGLNLGYDGCYYCLYEYHQFAKPDNVIILAFQHAGFKGNAIELSQNCDNLGKYGFNDTISSLKVAKGYRCKAWQHANYKGNYRYYEGAVDYVEGFNDTISSIEILKISEVTDALVTLFQHAGFKGNIVELSQNCDNLGKYGFNDTVSSLKVAKGYRCKAWQHANYKGNYRYYEGAVDYVEGFNDTISSIEIFKIS